MNVALAGVFCRRVVLGFGLVVGVLGSWADAAANNVNGYESERYKKLGERGLPGDAWFDRRAKALGQRLRRIVGGGVGGGM